MISTFTIFEQSPSAGLSKQSKSKIVKLIRKGKDIGKPGKGFQKIVSKSSKKYGKDVAQKIAAAAMWRNIKR